MINANNATASLLALISVFSTSALAARLLLPPLSLGDIEHSGQNQNQNAAVHPNVSLSDGLRQLPPDPAIFEAPDVPSTVVRIHNYGRDLGPPIPHTIVIQRAINAAMQHPSSSHIQWTLGSYTVDNVPVELWVHRIYGDTWFGESMTWGQWGGAAKVLLNFTRDWEFVELNFEVVNATRKRDIAFGQLRRRRRRRQSGHSTDSFEG